MEKISTQIISKVKAMSITTIVFISVLGVQTLAAAVCLIVGWLNSSAAEFMGMNDELTVASILTGIVLNIFTVRILFHFLSVFSSAAKEGTPFTSENANRIKKIGVTILVASIIVPHDAADIPYRSCSRGYRLRFRPNCAASRCSRCCFHLLFHHLQIRNGASAAVR